MTACNPRDCVYTPEWAVAHLAWWLARHGPSGWLAADGVLDPFAGDGAMLEAFARHWGRYGGHFLTLHACEIRPSESGAIAAALRRAELDQRGAPGVVGSGDFMADGWGGPRVGTIVTNPPYKTYQLERVLQRCIGVAETVIALTPTRTLQTQKRSAWWGQYQTGLQFVLLLGPRPAFRPAAEVIDLVDAKGRPVVPRKSKGATDNAEYAWMVFRRGFRGYPRVAWLPSTRAIPAP